MCRQDLICLLSLIHITVEIR